MNVNQAFPSQYLKAADLGDVEPVVTIARVALEAIGRDKDHKLVLYFNDKSKGLVLNKTNAKKIAELAGSPETDDWIGQRIRLFTSQADFAGETFDVIRVKPPAATRPPTPPPKPVADPGTMTADDIPF